MEARLVRLCQSKQNNTSYATGVIYEFIVVSIFYWIIATSIAELASAIPSSGGVYHWASVTPGKRWGRIVGFYAGYWNWLAWVFGAASMSFIFCKLNLLEPSTSTLTTYGSQHSRPDVWRYTPKLRSQTMARVCYLSDRHMAGVLVCLLFQQGYASLECRRYLFDTGWVPCYRHRTVSRSSCYLS
jgi:amino acid transporter